MLLISVTHYLGRIELAGGGRGGNILVHIKYLTRKWIIQLFYVSEEKVITSIYQISVASRCGHSWDQQRPQMTPTIMHYLFP